MYNSDKAAIMTMRNRVADWRRAVVDAQSTLAETLEVIMNSGYQIALIVGENDKLVGVVTDGDVRRALLRGVELEAVITIVMNKTPFVVDDKLGDREAGDLMSINHFLHIPIVNDRGAVVGLHVAEHLFVATEFKEAFVIMAGGKGSRLMPLTANTPKPMLKLNDKPILEHVINKARKSGFRKFYISVNYLAETITDYFGDGDKFGVSINYIKEERPLGTAGALHYIPEIAKDSNIVVTNCDVITDVCYGELLSYANVHSVDGLMAVRMQELRNPFGVVKTKNNKLVALEEKPTYKHQVNAGIYVLGPKMLSSLKENEYCDMTDLFAAGIEESLNMEVFPLHESWIDVGNPSDYKVACSYFR